jgi:hypothetical protein
LSATPLRLDLLYRFHDLTLGFILTTNKMKNIKSTKTLRSFLDSSLNLSEMKKIIGGQEGCILGRGPIAFAEFLWCLQQDS